MSKFLPIAILLALMVAPTTAMAKKKSKKYEKQAVTIAAPKPAVEEPKEVTITNPAKQLYGEWNIESIRKKDVVTQERAYIYLDFAKNKVYGNNGCNTINGTFILSGNNISFGDFITSLESCHSVTSERTIMKSFDDVKSYNVTTLYNIEYLNLLNSKGNQVMVLKRQNLDFMNGAWGVKELNGTNVSDKNIRVVIDTQMYTILANTSCNLINGVVNIDATKDFAIQFEDLKSQHKECPNIEAETDMLLALESTESCKRINDDEMALLDNKGTIIIVLHRVDLKQERAAKLNQTTN
jgi:heat shock protein HslJ